MAAWNHSRFWNPSVYEADYRQYVKENAEKYEGDTADCADLSVSLLIDFASSQGLALTFYDNAGTRYISKAERQSPRGAYSWSDKAGYTKAVRARIGARSLFHQNMEPNPQGPAPGDLMIKDKHAAIVFGVLPAGMIHGSAAKYGGPGGVPLFPGAAQAAIDINQTKYFRSEPIAPVQSPYPHIDYLNHRGEGTPQKKKAELIYFADVQEMRNDGFYFFRYRRHVRDNWESWNGKGDPPL